MPDINNKIAYIIAVVNEFSTRFSLKMNSPLVSR